MTCDLCNIVDEICPMYETSNNQEDAEVVNTASDKVDNLMNIPVGDEMLITEDIPVVSNVVCACNATS